MSFASRFLQGSTVVCVTSVLLFFAGPVGAQQAPLSPAERGKLDGVFQLLMDRKPQRQAGANRRSIGVPTLESSRIQRGRKVHYRVIIHTDDPEAIQKAGIKPNSVSDGFATARVTVGQIRALARMGAVSRVEVPARHRPHNDEAAREVGARILNEGAVNDTNYKGQGVITCVIDTGIDYDHRDFYKANGDTRIVRIWDQPDSNDSTGTGTPANFDYGAEYTASEINAGNVSEKDTDGHGTHVTGTVASSGIELVLDGTQSDPEHRGMAPKADIAMVKTTFSGSDIIDGLNYCDQLGVDEGKPVVINMSLGTDDAPHDGTSALAQAVDQVSGAGTIAAISAGNSGRPSQQIHTTANVASAETSTEPWTVGSYSSNSGTSNDYFLTTFWIDGTNDLQIIVRSPGDAHTDTLTATGTGTVQEFTNTPDGAIYIESGVSSDNNDRYFDVQVYDDSTGGEPAEGTWNIDVTNNGSTSTTYHGWTHRQTVPGSFDNGDNEYSIGSPGTAASAVTVGSYVHRWRWADSSDNSYAYDSSSDNRDDISTFSSRGPLRDGSQKPDIAAPGQGMISALSLDKPSPSSSRIVSGGKHRILQGTSMSAPTVAGSVALLLQEDGSLTPSDVKTYLTDNADVDSFVTASGPAPNDAFGAGKLNVLGAMVDLVGGSTAREILSYEDSWDFNTNGNQTVGGGGAQRVALRFTPNNDGFVTGVLLNLGTAPAHSLTDSLNVEVWSDDGSGGPKEKLNNTNTVQVHPSQLNDFSPTALSLSPSSAEVQSGTDYHLVVYPNTSSEEIEIGYETAGSASGRSHTDDGSSWNDLGADLIVRPEISFVDGTSTTLPVELAAFSGTANGSAVTLTWATASETSNAGFRLHHKTPKASSFQQATFVQGSGTTSNAHTYRHTLDGLSPGTHTFRLHQVDTDGTVNVGPETTVTVGMQTAYDVTAVSPNPVRKASTVSVTVREAQEVQATVYNVLGQRVATLHDGTLPAEDPTTLTVGSSLPSGVYFLRVDGESFTTTQKFVRVR